MNTVFLLIGSFGSGKTWVANQVVDRFHVFHYDKTKPDKMQWTNPPDLLKPILYDIPVNTITVINRIEPLVDLRVVAVIEELDVVKMRIMGRGKNYNEENIARRIKRIKGLAARFAEFSGTSSEVLEYMQYVKY